MGSPGKEFTPGCPVLWRPAFRPRNQKSGGLGTGACLATGEEFAFAEAVTAPYRHTDGSAGRGERGRLRPRQVGVKFPPGGSRSK